MHHVGETLVKKIRPGSVVFFGHGNASFFFGHGKKPFDLTLVVFFVKTNLKKTIFSSPASTCMIESLDQPREKDVIQVGR